MPQLKPIDILLYRQLAAKKLDTFSADRLAFTVGCMGLNMIQGVLLTSLLAKSAAGQETPAAGLLSRSLRSRRIRSFPASAKTKVPVPNCHHLTDLEEIGDHLRQQNLRSQIHPVMVSELKTARVLDMRPPPGTLVDADAEIHVVVGVPAAEAKHGDAEQRGARK